MTVFTVLYVILAVVEVRLMAQYAKAGPATEEQPPAQDPRLGSPFRGSGPGDGTSEDDDGDESAESDKPMIFAY